MYHEWYLAYLPIWGAGYSHESISTYTICLSFLNKINQTKISTLQLFKMPQQLFIKCNTFFACIERCLYSFVYPIKELLKLLTNTERNCFIFVGRRNGNKIVLALWEFPFQMLGLNNVRWTSIFFNVVLPQ